MWTFFHIIYSIDNAWSIILYHRIMYPSRLGINIYWRLWCICLFNHMKQCRNRQLYLYLWRKTYRIYCVQLFKCSYSRRMKFQINLLNTSINCWMLSTTSVGSRWVEYLISHLLSATTMSLTKLVLLSEYY